MAKASNKELLAKQNFMLQLSIHDDRCQVGISSKWEGRGANEWPCFLPSLVSGWRLNVLLLI